MENQDHILRNMPHFIAAVAALIFICSIFYNYGYCHGANISFFKLPLNIEDINTTSIKLTPMVVGVLTLSYFYILAMRWVEKNMNKNTKIRNSVLASFYLIELCTGAALILIFCIFLPGGIEPTLHHWGLYVIFYCGWLLATFVLLNKASGKLIALKRYLAIFPAILLIFFMTGFEQAKKNINTSNPNQIIRPLSRGIISKNTHNQIVFRPWEELEADHT